MNKTELIAAVAEKAGLTKKDVEKTITATLETVKAVSYTHLTLPTIA